MRIFAVVLGIGLLLLQYRVWISEQGVSEVSRLKSALETQSGENRRQSERNRQLAAEVANLKDGMNALEERARSELGMIGSNETFYQVVKGDSAAQAGGPAQDASTPGASAPITAREQ
jgi:cell division protein FtsB